jgi:hypothetical protein
MKLFLVITAAIVAAVLILLNLTTILLAPDAVLAPVVGLLTLLGLFGAKRGAAR